jgi:hypothetical protein
MKLRYLPIAQPGLHWFRACYAQNPQLELANAVEALRRTEATLRDFPFSGARYEDFDAVRAHTIAGTEFSLLYSLSRDTIWILDVRDPRGQRSAEALRSFAEGSAQAVRRLVRNGGRSS